MNPTETRGVDTPLDTASMSPSDYVANTERKWNVVERIIGVVNNEVKSEELTPLEGAKLTACITAEIFDHSAFHGAGILGIAPADLLTYGARLFGGEQKPR